MNREELLAALLAERFGPLATLVPEHPAEVVRLRRRVLIESLREVDAVPARTDDENGAA